MDLWQIIAISFVIANVVALVVWRLFVTAHKTGDSTREHVDLLTPEAVMIGKAIGIGSYTQDCQENCWIIQLKDIIYYIQTKKSLEETAEWLDEYSNHGPVCERCSSLILPGYSVHKIERKYYHGPPYRCSDYLNFHWGSVDNSGKLVPDFESGRNVAEETFMTGKLINKSVKTPTLDKNEYIVEAIARIHDK